MKQNNMLAMILAGGRGSRLHELTNKVAKPAVSYGGKYRIVDFPLSNCANSGVDIVGVLTQYESVLLNSYVAAGGRWGLDARESGVFVLPPREKADADLDVYRGTADAISQNIDFIEKLKEGYDLIQGSRFIKGGKAINTPFIRTVSVKLIHAPIISLTAHQRFTDTTNAYRAYSRRYLTDERVQPLRDVFMTYELLAYLSVRATQIGYKACEIPVKRAYPKTGKTPTKISFFKGNSELMSILLKNARGAYNPKQR